MAGPVATLQVTRGVLVVLAAVLALLAGDIGVALTALGVTGLVPVAIGVLIRASGRREREEEARSRSVAPPRSRHPGDR
jgi:hypothetical protein